VQRIPENISGVATVSLQAVEDATAGDTLRYAGLGAGGHRTSEAKKAFRQAVHILIRFASLRNTCLLLDEAIRSTLRYVLFKYVSTYLVIMIEVKFKLF
jgi:V-type H+-transporting ATPase subunit D